MQSTTPRCTHHGLGSFHFARRYFGNRGFFLLLGVLRCFSSPGSLPYVMDWRMDDWSSSSRVSPFRYLRLNGYLLLPAAFRSLSRLSSALSAKASAMRPSLLSLSIRSHLRAGGMIYTFSSLLLKLLFACTICHRSFIFVSYVSDGVENNGFEPLTLCVQGRCSSQLS